jgi:hypothetical protein
MTVTARQNATLPTVCVRCHRDCGVTSYYFGTAGPLCEICADNLQKHAIEIEPQKQRETFARWIGRLLRWW